MRTTNRMLVIVILITFLAVVAYAAINFKSGPTFSISGFNLITTGELSGLGSTAHVLVDAVGTATGTCTNPSGANQPPGQNPVNITASGSATVHPDQNGRSSFTVTASPVASPNPCPNGRWDFEITSVTYTSATIFITAGGNQTFGPQTYTLTNCTETDPNVPVSCTATPQ